MNITVEVPGKLVLIGEYAVLEGAPSLVMAVDRFARIVTVESSTERFTINSPPLQIFNANFAIDKYRNLQFIPPLSPEIRKKLSLFIHTFELLIRKDKEITALPPLNITLDTNDFYLPETGQKMGLGSSAALTVGLVISLIRRVNPNSEIIRDPVRLYQICQEIHFAVQGNKGSGIDIAASCFGGVLRFQRNKRESPQILPLSLPEGLYLIPVWTGQSTSTRKFIGRVNRFKKSQTGKYRLIMNQLTEISSEGCLAYQGGEIISFLQCCQKYYLKLGELGKASGTDIISPCHSELAEIAAASGAVYKPSGAGGGDIGIAFTDSPKTAKKVSEIIWHSGYQTLNFSMARRDNHIGHD